MSTLQERLKTFLEGVDKAHSDYRGDPDMDQRRADIFCVWLSEIESSMKTLVEKLSEKELSALLDVVENLYEGKYFLGTPYGSGSGTRPVVETLRSFAEQHEFLCGEEARIAYLSALRTIHNTFAPQVDPSWHYQGESEKQLNPEIQSLNQRIRTVNPDERLKIIRNAEANKIEVTAIEDIEYIGSSIFTGLGPLCFDFGDFGIEENSYLLVPHMELTHYSNFKEQIVERRKDNTGFRFETHEVDYRGVPVIRGLAERILSTSVVSPTYDTTRALGLTDELTERMQQMMREEMQRVITAGLGEEEVMEKYNKIDFVIYSFKLRNVLATYVLQGKPAE